ncbi:hypothetical protein KCU93_g187, partial [Aureobasidium melanogenum]
LQGQGQSLQTVWHSSWLIGVLRFAKSTLGIVGRGCDVDGVGGSVASLALKLSVGVSFVVMYSSRSGGSSSRRHGCKSAAMEKGVAEVDCDDMMVAWADFALSLSASFHADRDCPPPPQTKHAGARRGPGKLLN